MTHEEREQIVLSDLQKYFPDFGGPSSWTKVPDRQEPPDFISDSRSGPIGLELREWLDGEQMTAAKGRESQRDQVHGILAANWETEYQPKHFRGAFLTMGNDRISPRDEAPLRREFYALAAEVDSTWLTNPDRTGKNYAPMDLPGYPLMQKYFSVRYIGGEPPGFCWIHSSGDGGAYDPEAAVNALQDALDDKLALYSTPASQARLRAHRLIELSLLVHGGFNAFAYNTLAAPFPLEEVARRASTFYATHPQRQLFNRVWFFNSLDSADELNQLIGFAPEAGRMRWLSEIWPDFRVLSSATADYEAAHVSRLHRTI